jgi:hypothetical protein
MAGFLWVRKLRPHTIFVFGLLGFSFLAISVGLYYRGHYFIMAYPVLGMLAGIGCSLLRDLFRKLNWHVVAPILPGTIFVLTFANALYADRRTYFFDSPQQACRYVYGSNPFSESVGVVGDYIRQNSRPDAKIAVLGSEPEIYFYARRLSATGYMYTYPLVENQPYGRVMQTEMIKEIETVKPEIIVYVLMHESWNIQAGADQRIFDWADSYVKQRYTLEGIADGGNHNVYRWGQDAGQYRPRKPEVILVYRRHS